MDFDGEAFGAEIVSAVKNHIATSVAPLVSRIESLEATIVLLSAKEQDESCMPPEMAEEISKASALLAESPQLHPANQASPVVVNFSPPNTARKSKTITTRRDDKGNLVARVVEDFD